MRNWWKILPALPVLAIVGAEPSAACGRGWNVDAYGRCFPAYLGDGVATGPTPRYVPRAYYAPDYYGRRPHSYRRSYDPGPAIALGIIGAAAAAVASQPRYYRTKRYRYR